MEEKMSTNSLRSTAIPSHRGHVRDSIKHAWGTLKPGPLAWKGAALGLLVVALFFTLIASHTVFLAQPRIVSFLVGSAQFIAVAAIVGALLVLLVALIKRIPAFYGWALVFALVLLFVSFFASIMGSVSPTGMLIFMLEVIVVASLLGSAVWVLVRGGWRQAAGVQHVITVLCLVLGLAGLAAGANWLLDAGQTVEPPPNAAAMSAAQVTPLNMPDPSQPGLYEVRTLFYGTGEDRQRPEYGAGVELVTGSVDGSPFTNGWSSARINYWGFGPEALPINGRVWYPDGAGPFPLVLIVHGDHVMTEFSDPGYDYLGELLASRGFILASVDANFLNHGIPPEGRPEDENDARGWLMLEHLRIWKAWNQTQGNPFYQKVDMNNIAVMGHSRGGEAAPIAAAFNRLPYYPDDATVSFDYNYNIRSVVAIAPVFETYKPRGRNLPLENVNYFVLQGSNDSQILSFMGLNQYSRVAFTDENYWFKTSLYVYGANHGQFNTVWVTDQTAPSTWLYNQQAVMPFEEQKHIAEVYISAFLEATLRGKTGYIPLFRDFRAAHGWLPDTIYLNQFQDSSYQLVSTYEEDMNAATTTMPGGVQSGQNLSVWREQAVELIASMVYGPIDNSAVYLGWNAGVSKSPASYTIRLPDEELALDADSTLVFSLADANEDPSSGTSVAAETASQEASGQRQPIDLTVEVVDRSGHATRLPLSKFSYLQPQIVMTLMKAPYMNIAGPSPSEPVFQSYEFPLAAFVQADPVFDPASLTTVRFIFDRTPAGVVVLDDVGFRN
jgi:predicted dienelactone hydrolase